MNILLYGLLSALALVALFQAYLWYSTKRIQGKAAPISSGSGRHLYYFFSPRCGACKNVTPVIDRISQRHENVHKVDVSMDANRAMAFGVRATPTLMMVEDGRISRVMLGGTSERTLDEMLTG